MKLSLFYFTYYLFILLSTADQTEVRNNCYFFLYLLKKYFFKSLIQIYAQHLVVYYFLLVDLIFLLERRNPYIFLHRQKHQHHRNIHEQTIHIHMHMVLQFIFDHKLQVNLVKKFVPILIYLNQNFLQKKNEQN
jgi:hypothetical protein